MRLFDVLNQEYRTKKLQADYVLSQKEYKEKFFCDDEYIKREFYEEDISRRLSEEFGMKYSEKAKKWYSEWKDSQRFVVKLERLKGDNVFLQWGYNYDFIPGMNNQDKLIWYRTDKAIKLHTKDSWYYHINKSGYFDFGHSKQDFYNPRTCKTYQYMIPTTTSDMEFALQYINGVVEKNIPLMREYVDNIKTIDDAIEFINEQIAVSSCIVIPYMCHVRAFLYAKNKDIEKAILSIKEGYYGSDKAQQILIERLKQLADQ